jgi:hypothetical protein
MGKNLISKRIKFSLLFFTLVVSILSSFNYNFIYRNSVINQKESFYKNSMWLAQSTQLGKDKTMKTQLSLKFDLACNSKIRRIIELPNYSTSPVYIKVRVTAKAKTESIKKAN